MRVLLVSPYHGGSHASWAEGLCTASAHEFELLTLPDRFWKWRMHGGAATLARRFLRDGARPDAILATDMLDLTTFLALTRRVTARVPVILYMHENQLTYPLPDDPDTGPMRRQGGERDHHYAFVNYASMLAADRVVFNSGFHRRSWFEALPRFLRHFPEYNELGTVRELRDKSTVIPVGITCSDDSGEVIRSDESAPGSSATSPLSGENGGEAPATGHASDEPPLLIWNQRWEYDKNPGQLVRALGEVAALGVPFRLALCGQSFNATPIELQEAREQLDPHIIQFGFAEPDRYRRLLRDAAVTTSTARHEFFGIGVLEAMAGGAFAVLPNRLSYPELLAGDAVSDATRRRSLYDSHEELVSGLAWALRNVEASRRHGRELARNARRFCWSVVAPLYDEALASAAQAAS